jgi:hypothetical protein
MLRQTILDFAEQKASYLGLRSYRHRNMSKEGLLLRLSTSFIFSYHYSEMMKLGPDARTSLFIQLANFPNHYLVIVITDERFKYALITTKGIEGILIATMVLEDIAWIDSDRIQQAGAFGPPNAKSNTPLKLAAVGYRAERGYSGWVELSSSCFDSAELCPIASTWIHGHCGNSTIIAGKLEPQYSGLELVDIFAVPGLPS